VKAGTALPRNQLTLNATHTLTRTPTQTVQQAEAEAHSRAALRAVSDSSFTQSCDVTGSLGDTAVGRCGRRLGKDYMKDERTFRPEPERERERERESR